MKKKCPFETFEGLLDRFNKSFIEINGINTDRIPQISKAMSEASDGFTQGEVLITLMAFASAICRKMQETCEHDFAHVRKIPKI